MAQHVRMNFQPSQQPCSWVVAYLVCLHSALFDPEQLSSLVLLAGLIVFSSVPSLYKALPHLLQARNLLPARQ